MSGALQILDAGARAQWKSLYQVNPLYLTGGSFANAPGSIFPFSSLTNNLLSGIVGVLSGNSPNFGEWMVMPGGKMVNQSVVVYPFASQQVAANATVQEPLTLSMLLRAPITTAYPAVMKPAILTAVQAALNAHNNAGGTYTIFTPGLFYQNGLLLNVFDATDGETKQEQVDWQFDFFFPLITGQAASAAFSTAMQKLVGGQPVIGQPTWSSLSSPSSSSVVPLS